MTTLNKPIRRMMELDNGRVRLVVEIHPTGFFSFREKGARVSYTMPIMTAYRFAVDAAGKSKIKRNK